MAGRRRVIGTLAGMTLFSAAVGLATAGTAQAADYCQPHPSDLSVTCVRYADVRKVDVCDRDPDGHRAYARVYLQGDANYITTPYDPNDSQAGCGNFSYSKVIKRVAICVQYEGCSAFRSIP